MNLIDDNLNIEKMYKYQLNEEIDEDYEKYLKYLTLFYQKEHKKEKFNKDYLNDKFLLIDKSNPKKKIEITPAQFINIHKLYIRLKDYSETILQKISNIIESKNNITEEDRKEFDFLKMKYSSFRDKTKDIETINLEYYNQMENLFNNKIEKSTQLAKYYQKRNINYTNINVMINEKLKNKLIAYFRENKKKIPSQNIINKIAKENSISSNEIEKWFLWIESVYFYMIVSNEIININNEIKVKENTFDMNTKYMIIKKPIVKE